MNRILFEAGEIEGTPIVRVTGNRARHIVNILRARPGQVLRVACINGPCGSATIRAVQEESVILECSWNADRPQRPPVDLLLALPRPKVMRRLWPQLAAMGVDQIILSNAAKVERMYFDSHVLKPEIYRPLLIEGLQQAGDTCLPDVCIVRRLKPWLEDELQETVSTGLRLVADNAYPVSFRETVATRNVPCKRVLLAVGPEGGWTEYELKMFRAHGFHSFSAGSRTLRTDTACIALLALVHDALAAKDSMALVP